MSFQTIRQSLVKKSVLLIAALSLVAGAQLVALADGVSVGTACCIFQNDIKVQSGCIYGGCTTTYPNDPNKAKQCMLNATDAMCAANTEV